MLSSIGIFAQEQSKIVVLDSNHVSIEIDEFRHIISVNKAKNNKDSIDSIKDKKILLLEEIISNHDEKDSLNNEQIKSLKEMISIQGDRPFYDSFIFGLISGILIILGGAIAF